MATLLKKQFCSSLLSHIGTEEHLISNGSSALLCRLCTCLKSSAGSAGLLDASQFDMGLLHRDNHNLSSWKMLPHYHCGFFFNLTIACLHPHSQTRNEWNRNGNINRHIRMKVLEPDGAQSPVESSAMLQGPASCCCMEYPIVSHNVKNVGCVHQYLVKGSSLASKPKTVLLQSIS